jgi:hypothetical protein
MESVEYPGGEIILGQPSTITCTFIAPIFVTLRMRTTSGEGYASEQNGY